MTRLRVGCLIVFGSLILAGGLFVTALLYGWYRPIRCYLDLTFNLTKEFVTYETGTEYTLPLPKGVAWGYRESDYSCVYLTRLTYDEFISWYEENGYIVEENRVYKYDKSDEIWYTIEYRDKEEQNKKDKKIKAVLIKRHVKYYN